MYLSGKRLRAPVDDGEVLIHPSPDQFPAFVSQSLEFDWSRLRIGQHALDEFRRSARSDVQELCLNYHESLGETRFLITSDTWLLAGHQPDLFHPGVWLKNFVLARLAKQHGAIALNLIVDNDVPKATAIRLPYWRADVAAEDVFSSSLVFDAGPDDVPYEVMNVSNEAMFRSVPESLRLSTADWPFAPFGLTFWERALRIVQHTRNTGAIFACTRRFFEHLWGADNLELPVSHLCRSQAFQKFATTLLDDLPRFHSGYNYALRSYRKINGVKSRHHPVPELAKDGDWLEAPFWVLADGKRRRLWCRNGETKPTGEIRPRALTLTLFARLALADVFIHGIGGGKYDELTDAICECFFGFRPPPFMVVSGTLRLPLPTFPISDAEYLKLLRLERDYRWNPQRMQPDHPLASERRQLIELPITTKADRSNRADLLRKNLANWPNGPASSAIVDAKHALEANALLQSRDYSFVLYPESKLREWLTGQSL